MRFATQWVVLAMGAVAASAGYAQSVPPSMQQAISRSSQPSNYLRATLPGLHEWLKELERNGIVDRSLPRPYRVALPIAQWGNGAASLKITYAAMPGSDARGVVLFINIPLH